MINFIFEDKITSFPYPLLTRVLGSQIHGSEGKDKIPEMIDNIGDNTIVLVDVTPDTRETVNAYTSAIQCASKYKNVYVIPIPCIEYYFISAVLGYINADTVAVINAEDYTKHTHNIDKRKLMYSSNFEKFCKSVLRNYTACMISGKYVTSQCICDNKPYRLTCEELTLDNKSMRLIYGIPTLCLYDKNIEDCKNYIKNA